MSIAPCASLAALKIAPAPRFIFCGWGFPGSLARSRSEGDGAPRGATIPYGHASICGCVAPLGAPSRHLQTRGLSSRHQFRAALPGSRALTPRPSPASSSQRGHSAARHSSLHGANCVNLFALPRNRPGAKGQRCLSPAGAAPAGFRETSVRKRSRFAGTRRKVWCDRISGPFPPVRPALARFAKAPLGGRGAINMY